MRTRLVFILRLGPSGATLGPYTSVSLALHGIFVLGLLLAPSLRPRPAQFGDVLVAEMVGDLPGSESEPASPGARAPVPAAPPRPEEVRAETRAVKPPELPKKKEEKKRKENGKETRNEPPKPVPSAAGGPTNATPGPPGGGTGAAKGNDGITSLDAGDVEFAWYRASVIAALRSHWTRPVLEETEGTLVAQAAFEVRRDGMVQNARIETSSGVPVMDRSVLRALVESSPFPPLPLTWREPVLAARVEFRLQPDSP